MNSKANGFFQCLAGALMCLALTSMAQTQTTSAPPPAPTPAQSTPAPATPATPAPADTPPAAATTTPTWSVGGIDFSGYLDAYGSYNVNRPSVTANGQINDLYNFNDKTDQFNLSAAKITINHDPDPVGVHVDVIFGRTNAIIHAASETSTVDYLEQAFISFKPPKAKGLELDFGQFVTSAGAEVIEAKDDWNYSRSLLFSWAIPYYHFGLRSSYPVTKTWTAGVQVVNGWNNVNASNGGVTVGVTSAYVKPKYTWNVNYYTGPQNFNTQNGYRNLIDTTLLLTPTPKFSAYINYDYGQNRNPATAKTVSTLDRWQGIAVAAVGNVSAKSSIAGRFEYYTDPEGFTTGTAQDLYEFTGTYQYKWLEGLLTRAEFRRDWSDVNFFHKGDSQLVAAQTTFTVGFIAFFGPKR